MALSNRSIPFWFSFSVFFSISTLVFGFCFAYLFPIAEIPSDDTVYGANIVAVSNCFADAPKNNPLCIPGPSISGYAGSVNSLKPALGFLGGLTYASLRPFYPFSGVDILSLLNFVSLSIAVSLMCAALANSRPVSSILTFLLIVCSVTTHGTLIWTGYAFIVLLLLVLIFILHSRQGKLPLGNQIAISSLLALLIFIHISTLPWIVAYFLIFAIQSYRGSRQVGKVSYYPWIRILIITVAAVLVIDRLGAIYGSMSYIESYVAAYKLNVDSTTKIISHVVPESMFSLDINRMLGMLSIPFYYISVEPLLVVLFFISVIAYKNSLSVFFKDFAARSNSFLSSPYGMAVGATLIATLIISVSPTEKLLRLFAPAHLGICVALSILISDAYLKGKKPIRIVISLCLLASFQYSISDSFYQYSQRSPVPRALEKFTNPSSYIFSFQDDPLTHILSKKKPDRNSSTDHHPLVSFYPIVVDEHKEHYLALKFLTKDYDRFHLMDDQESALASMGIGDFLLTSLAIEDPGIGYVDSIKLILDKMSTVNHWQSNSGARRNIDGLLSGDFLVGLRHIINHIMWADLSDESFTLHIYQKCGSFEGYVNRYDDLSADYIANSGGQSKNEWGKQHYCTHGIDDGRTYSWLSASSCLACN